MAWPAAAGPGSDLRAIIETDPVRYVTAIGHAHKPTGRRPTGGDGARVTDGAALSGRRAGRALIYTRADGLPAAEAAAAGRSRGPRKGAGVVRWPS